MSAQRPIVWLCRCYKAKHTNHVWEGGSPWAWKENSLTSCTFFARVFFSRALGKISHQKGVLFCFFGQFTQVLFRAERAGPIEQAGLIIMCATGLGNGEGQNRMFYTFSDVKRSTILGGNTLLHNSPHRTTSQPRCGSYSKLFCMAGSPVLQPCRFP